MREIRPYGSEGGGAVGSPYPYPRWSGRSCARFLPEGADLKILRNGPFGIGEGRQALRAWSKGWTHAVARRPLSLRATPPGRGFLRGMRAMTSVSEDGQRVRRGTKRVRPLEKGLA